MLTAYGAGVKKKKRKLEREGGQKSREEGKREKDHRDLCLSF